MQFAGLLALAFATLAAASPVIDARGALDCRGPCGDNNSACVNGLCAGAVGVCNCAIFN